MLTLTIGNTTLEYPHLSYSTPDAEMAIQIGLLNYLGEPDDGSICPSYKDCDAPYQWNGEVVVTEVDGYLHLTDEPEWCYHMFHQPL